MVDTTDIKEVVVTPETPLDPSPKRVEGHEIGETVSADLGSVAGTLHKPPLKIETEDKGQSTAEELVKSAEERPQVFKNVVLDNLKAKGLIQIKDKNALVDRFGNPVIKNTVESYPVCPLDVSGGDTQREFDMTPELEQFFQECFEKSKIAIKEGSNLYLMNLGATCVAENKISGMCFGCDYDHKDTGSHCEISFNDDRTKVYIAFVIT